jgi:Tfp pilus assembly protein PilF
VRNFRVALAAGPVDRATTHTDLAESLLRAGDRAEARRQALAALEIAPTYERAQDILLRIAGGPR